MMGQYNIMVMLLLLLCCDELGTLGLDRGTTLACACLCMDSPSLGYH